MADFFSRTRELEDLVGEGTLHGELNVDGGGRTIPLEVGYWVNHMGRNGYVAIENYSGGINPHAIAGSLQATYQTAFRRIAEETLEQGPDQGMVEGVRAMRREFQNRAPVVTGSYRDSWREYVVDYGSAATLHLEDGAHYGQEPGLPGS